MSLRTTPPRHPLVQLVAPLVPAARRGCPVALGKLVELLAPYLRVIARQSLPSGQASRSTVSDVVQDALAQMAIAIPTLRNPNPQAILAWSRRVVRNRARTIVRRQRFADGSLREVPLSPETLQEQASTTPDPLTTLMAREERTYLARVLKRLHPDQRKVLLWRHQQGLTYEQIGHRLDCSERTAKRLWARAMATLRRATKAIQDDPA